MEPGKREGVSTTTRAVAALLAEEEYLTEKEARRLFDELAVSKPPIRSYYRHRVEKAPRPD
jgi:hypothetical protein